MDSKFAQQPDIQQIRDGMNGRIGEIIDLVIGDDRLKELYEAGGKTPATLPSGQEAVQMGLVSQDTKTALLVAQAAERTLRLADKAENFARNHEQMVNKNDALKTKIDAEAAGVKPESHPDFKFIGSDRDPNILKAAQGTMLAAQMYLNNEVSAINHSGAFDFNVTYSAGSDFADGLRTKAIGYYNVAAGLLKKEGHAAAADNLSAVAQTLAQDVRNPNAPGPADLMKTLVKNEEDAVWDRNMTDQRMGGEGNRVGFNSAPFDRITGLVSLAEPASSTAPATQRISPAPLKM